MYQEGNLGNRTDTIAVWVGYKGGMSKNTSRAHTVVKTGNPDVPIIGFNRDGLPYYQTRRGLMNTYRTEVRFRYALRNEAQLSDAEALADKLYR